MKELKHEMIAIQILAMAEVPHVLLKQDILVRENQVFEQAVEEMEF